jgi:aryl-alcohol dehydrogenase-like predicted oxidoreductase
MSMIDPGERHRLGQTDTYATRLTIGGTPFGDMYDIVSDETARATVRRACELGLRSFDTAPLYGVGKSERRLGIGISGLPRDELTICTKIGRILQDDDGTIPPTFAYGADDVHHSLAGSRQRLGIDRFDVVHVHDPDNHMEAALAGAFPTLRGLQNDEVIGAVSAGMNNPEPLARFIREGVVDSVMIAGRFSLLNQTAIDDLLPVAVERGVSVLVAGVFNSGILADPDADPRFVKYSYAPPSDKVTARVKVIRSICEGHGVSLRTAALQFPFLHPAVASIVVGCRHPIEVESNVRDLQVDVPSELWSDLVGGGFLRPETVASLS